MGFKAKNDGRKGEAERKRAGGVEKGKRRGDLLERWHVLSANNMILKND